MATEITPIQEVRTTLVKMQDQLKSALPSYISPDKFMQVVVTAVTLKPDLLSLDRPSLYSSCLACASDGLLPDGREAALVPYKGKVGYQPMVGGLMKLIRNSKEIVSIDAQTVFEGDTYESYTDERGPHFKHIKSREKRGKPILTFGYAITKDGATYHEEITEEEMHKIEACAKTAEVWKGPFRDEQYRKSVIKRLAKRLPKSTDVERVIDRDNEDYELPAAPKTTETTSSALRSAVTGSVEEAQTRPVDAVEEPKKDVQQESQKVSSVGNLTCRGTIEDKKSKPFVISEGPKKGQAGNKYDVKINGKWMGTFDTKNYEQIVAWEKMGPPPVLLDVEYVESPGKDKMIYLNLVSIKPVTVAPDAIWNETGDVKI